MPKHYSRFSQIVWSHLRGVRREIFLATLGTVGFTLSALLAPWPLKLIFDQILLDKPLPAPLAFMQDVLHGGSIPALIGLSLFIVMLALLRGMFSYYQLYLTSRIGHKMVYTLRGELFDHLQRLSLSFHNRARSGELLNKITGDTNTVKDVYAESALVFATHVLTIAGMFTIMFALNWKLSLIVLLSFPALGLAVYYVCRNVSASARRQRRNESKLASRVVERLAAVTLVQAYGRENYERQRFDTENAQSMEESIRAARMEAAAARIVDVISALGTGIVVLFGCLQVFRDAMTPGDVLVFASYITNIYKPMRTMARLSVKYSKAAVSAERISEILEIEPEIQDAPDAVEAVGLKGHIIFDNVSFGYENGKPVLQNVSFAIAPGQRVALVGASGAGKSTIANLIIRLYDPLEGAVLIDGRDVKCYRRESLRREIGVVLQDALLFGTTIRENIAYGKPDATPEEIEDAARRVYAHDFITALPDGYDTLLGERGCTLSGGQRQRICLARAIIKRSAILIMDEPTSAVDPESEALIRSAVGRLQQGKTILLIAHRFSTIQDCDQILVLKAGRIVERGSHLELVRRKGHYYELFRLQEKQSA